MCRREELEETASTTSPAVQRSIAEDPARPSDAEHDRNRPDADRPVAVDIADVRDLRVRTHTKEEVREDDERRSRDRFPANASGRNVRVAAHASATTIVLTRKTSFSRWTRPTLPPRESSSWRSTPRTRPGARQPRVRSGRRGRRVRPRARTRSTPARRGRPDVV